MDNEMLTEVRDDELEAALVCAEDVEAEVSKMHFRSDDPLKIFLHDIARFPKLTKEEEIALGKLKDAGSTEARERLINCNLKLVVSLAKKKYDQIAGISSMNVQLEDLISEGCMGLMTAVDKYDWRKNCKFSTNAVYWIVQAINAGIAQCARTIRIPDHKVDAMVVVKKADNALHQILTRVPTQEEIAAYLNYKLTVADVVELQGLIYGSGVVSIDAPLGEDAEDGTIADMIPDETQSPSEYAEQMTLHETINQAVDALPERERLVILMSFGLNDYNKKTLDEISEELFNRGYTNRDGKKITKEGVRQLRERTLESLKVQLGAFIG